jgi:large subunit ribosomal protein L24
MPNKKLNIRTGDEVMVIAGKDRSHKGRTRRGKVLKVDPIKERVVVEGMAMIKKATRQTQNVRQAGIVQQPGPMHISNCMLICPNCDAATRVARRRTAEGHGVRVCKKCKKDIDE